MSSLKPDQNDSIRCTKPADGAYPKRPQTVLSSWTTLGLSMGSGILLWASYPPFSLWPIAWVATIGWIVLIRQVRLVGPRPYLAIWFASIVHNLLLFQWIRLPHWSANFGLLALCLYLSVFIIPNPFTISFGRSPSARPHCFGRADGVDRA